MEKVLFLKSAKEAPKNTVIIDVFLPSLKELFFIEHPNLKKEMPEAQAALKNFLTANQIEGVWIYYPWANKLVHTLPEDLYFKLRTARNKNIISEEEQNKYRNLKIGIAGLSVGSSILGALVQSGGPKVLKIADPDNIEVTNLNRISATLLNAEENKTQVAARRALEIDPFAEIFTYEQGVNEDNLKTFILGSATESNIDIFIDEMDNVHLKILARFVCKENKIPVIMATDNGDGIILDIERFDLEPERQVFHGLLGDVKLDSFKNIDKKEWVALAMKIIGEEYMPARLVESLRAIGSELAGVAQLAGAANIAGSIVALMVRQIANGEGLNSGKYILGPENLCKKI
ncbi:MAG: ThiF family adenylyltransferase [bacterium]|nr:ThiF family adenylyltransferase [bacterium]